MVIRHKLLAKNQTDKQTERQTIFFLRIEMVVFALPLLLFRDTKNTAFNLKRLCDGQTDRNGPKSGLLSRVARD